MSDCLSPPCHELFSHNCTLPSIVLLRSHTIKLEHFYKAGQKNRSAVHVTPRRKVDASAKIVAEKKKKQTRKHSRTRTVWVKNSTAIMKTCRQKPTRETNSMETDKPECKECKVKKLRAALS